MDNNTQGNSSTGMPANVAAVLCYALGWLTGLVFFLLEKDSKFVKFHAMQSIVFFGALQILNIVLGTLGIAIMGGMIWQLLGLFSLAMWIVLMVKAYQGERFKLPVAGDIAEQNSK